MLFELTQCCGPVGSHNTMALHPPLPTLLLFSSLSPCSCSNPTTDWHHPHKRSLIKLCLRIHDAISLWWPNPHSFIHLPLQTSTKATQYSPQKSDILGCKKLIEVIGAKLGAKIGGVSFLPLAVSGPPVWIGLKVLVLGQKRQLKTLSRNGMVDTRLQG